MSNPSNHTSGPLADMIQTPEPPVPQLPSTPPPVPEKATTCTISRSYRCHNLSWSSGARSADQSRLGSPVPADTCETAIALRVVPRPPRSSSISDRPPTPPSNHFISTVRPPTGPNLAPVTTAEGQAHSISQAMTGLRLPWLKTNGGSGEEGNEAIKKCPDAPRALRTRRSFPHENSKPSSSLPAPPSTLRHDVHYGDLSRCSPEPQADSYPQSVKGSESSSLPVSGSSADIEEQIRRWEEDVKNQDGEGDATSAIYEAENEWLRAAIDRFHAAEKDQRRLTLKEENNLLKGRLRELHQNFEKPSGSINRPTDSKSAPRSSRNTFDDFFAQPPNDATNKRPRQEDTEVAELRTELRSGMSKMVKGIKDLTIKSGKYLSPKRPTASQVEAQVVLQPTEDLDGDVPDKHVDGGPSVSIVHRTGGVAADPPGDSVADLGVPHGDGGPPLPAVADHGDSPASRNPSKTSPTPRNSSSSSPIRGEEAPSKPIPESGQDSKSPSVRSLHLAEPPRKRSRAASHPLEDNGTIILSRKSISSGGLSRQHLANVAPSRRSHRVQGGHQSE